jgi:hypothetical protein
MLSTPSIISQVASKALGASLATSSIPLMDSSTPMGMRKKDLQGVGDGGVGGGGGHCSRRVQDGAARGNGGGAARRRPLHRRKRAAPAAHLSGVVSARCCRSRGSVAACAWGSLTLSE